MLHFQTIREGLPLFKALGSETRIAILELLIGKGPMRMTAIAEELNITGGALTTHVKMLNDAGILAIEARGGRHGIQKICRIADERIVVESPFVKAGLQVYESELELGQYVEVEAKAPCGIATPERLLQPQDDPAAFSSHERLRAGILWMQEGRVDYLAPNFVKAGQELCEVQVILEMGAGNPQEETAGPGSVSLCINDKDVGVLTLPAQEAGQYGVYNPVWWNQSNRQRGSHLVVSVDKSGTYLEGKRVSQVGLEDLGINGKRSLTFSVKSHGKEGFILFGKGFGSLSQGPRLRMYYKEKAKAATRAKK